VKSEVNFEILSVIYGVLSSAFLALYGIKVKSVIMAVDDDPWLVSLYNTILAIIFMIPVVLVSGEMSHFFEMEVIRSVNFWFFMTLAGVLGLLINIAMFIQIHYTSPLTSTLSGTVKACVQTVLGILFWKNEVTFMNAVGLSLVIGGSLWYSLVRYKAMKFPTKQPSNTK